mmetsp:Transcript_7011/g.11128  ORF Transcript_7011/g.11128 Transcript_7011/m.11128 type:complete len:352 (-) Transcript_7011:60-1115(-)|eukprot:CAMPEP_0203791482 /NCGR_PEP_ID=MMETSP0100_2-20121128/4659_1 /ASSEMBLY_ACC=CAM_ASM_000210 /TAXON_ID=96639 /ORGANISM=" , Strain NY0313808BC1" /LENGTH=351 /DNA_ID=CAMNT_0050694805 /DNA_START=12 /DNA_END=1067 /DNA_ORIENTATION=-
MVDTSERVVQAVLIPADTSSPIVDVGIKQPAGQAIECFMAYMKKQFAKDLMQASQLGEYKKQIQQHSKQQSIPDDILKRLAATTTVDMVVLYPNRKQTDFICINMYVDDKGVAKQLPVNIRATEICRACGLNTQVMGDAYIGKQFDDDDGFRRIDFTVKDLENGSEWMDAAKKLHNSAQTAASEAKMQEILQKEADNKKRDEQKRIAKEYRIATTKASELKDRGNALFQKGDFQGAIKYYSEGLAAFGITTTKEPVITNGFLSTNPAAHALFSNRSACEERLGNYNDALRDAVACTLIRPKWPKGWARKGEALIGLKRYPDAAAALQKGIALTPKGSEELKKRLNFVNEQL